MSVCCAGAGSAPSLSLKLSFHVSSCLQSGICQAWLLSCLLDCFAVLLALVRVRAS